ncbi:hypothetical protein OE88DRAFT_1738414 [Heliocybe sulcata]|uniref:Uncharacterized protein n=1 Tax=Heliocybe sulcata TaxID=5364 RepID=A0A5C3MQG1_9AGAM|nr:hypothetical protein OE88DRAFT_1738414 [Heliocybe sulcata]
MSTRSSASPLSLYPREWPTYTCDNGALGNPSKAFGIPGSKKTAYSWFCPGSPAGLASLAFNHTQVKDGNITSLVSESKLGKTPATPAAKNISTLGPGQGSHLGKRDISLVGQPCTVYCNSGTGGPDPNDCNQLLTADETYGDFLIPSGSYLVWTLDTCQVTQTNLLSPATNLTYSYDTNDWAGVVHALAYQCQAAENAMGGSCQFLGNTDVSVLQVQTAPS